ncbi:MAG: non-heme iron oxygenase ferredoxin subunit [Actinomycetota bacterium]|nr:non-heme iron oxygenase ferredoxin subunit [Actinomycetota bacterium]
MSKYETVAKVDEVEDGSMKQVVVDGELVGLYRVGREFFALSDICSHEEAYLTEGEFEPDEMEVECPRHGSRFHVESGGVRILPATKPVAAYDVKVEGDLVLVGPPKDEE